jgi:hypothetical protein
MIVKGCNNINVNVFRILRELNKKKLNIWMFSIFNKFEFHFRVLNSTLSDT